MADVQFLGGPWHRQHHPVAVPLPGRLLVTPEHSSPVVDIYAPTSDHGPEPVPYDLRRQTNGQPVYVAPDFLDVDRQRCLVPGCGQHARLTFIAAESGRLAGRDLQPGDEILLCPAHGNDVYRAQGVYGLDELPEWLRADAVLEPMDAFDASYDTIFGAEIDRSRRRMLRMTSC